MKTKIKKGRDAKTGKFVTDEFVKANPDTTVTDTVEVKEKQETKSPLEPGDRTY
jgi:hypothetical protein